LTARSAALVWFRRDLRCYDHAAPHAALTVHRRVFCAFVFDTDILDKLPSRRDRRVEFIWASVGEPAAALRALSEGLIVLHGSARVQVPALAERLGVGAVYANHDYKPQAVARDRAVERSLTQQGIRFHTRKDQVIFEKDEVLTGKNYPTPVVDHATSRKRVLAPCYFRQNTGVKMIKTVNSSSRPTNIAADSTQIWKSFSTSKVVAGPT
jgi:deoxyribodipyrimidine photo-lyase